MEAQANTTREQSNKMNKLATLARRYGGVGIKKKPHTGKYCTSCSYFSYFTNHHFFWWRLSENSMNGPCKIDPGVLQAFPVWLGLSQNLVKHFTLQLMMICLRQGRLSPRTMVHWLIRNFLARLSGTTVSGTRTVILRNFFEYCWKKKKRWTKNWRNKMKNLWDKTR